MATNSNKGKGQYANYKTENRAYKNKLRRFESIVKKFPNDEKAKETLKRLQKGEYKHKQRPLVAGSNPTTPKRSHVKIPHVETPGEQLSRLLGIPMPKIKSRRKRTKAAVVVRKKKNVKQS